MAITVKIFGLGQQHIVTGAVDMDTDTLAMGLTTSTWAPATNHDTYNFRDDVTNELVGNGYAQQTLAGKTVTYDSASDQVRFDCNDIAFAFNASSTFRRGFIAKIRGGAASADELISYLDWDSDQTVSTTYTLTIDATGLLYWDTT